MASDTTGDAGAWSETLETVPTTLVFAEERHASEFSGAAPRQAGRRLTDKILVAFHHACDLGDFEVAQDLLRILETILSRKPMLQHVARRRSMESLVAAHERLWQLRNPDA